MNGRALLRIGLVVASGYIIWLLLPPAKVLYADIPCCPNMTKRPAQKMTGTKLNTRTMMVLNRPMMV